jgi:FMN phosphatase YigB (HAD superfamily)
LDSIHSPEGLIKKAGALILDLDGTLYDTRGLAWHLTLARLRDAPLLWAERKTRKALAGRDFGSPAAYAGEFFSRMSQIAKSPPDTLRAWYVERYMPRICGVLKRHYRPRPGTVEFFADLARTAFPLAVYSDYPHVAERLSALGLDPGGAKLYGPEHFGAQKPAARPFLTIAKDLGLPPERTLVAGDRADTDGAGAAAAGMAFIGIKTRKKPEPSSAPFLAWETFCSLFREQIRSSKKH